MFSLFTSHSFAEILIAQTGRLAPAKKIPADPIDFKNFLFDLLRILDINLNIKDNEFRSNNSNNLYDWSVDISPA